MKKYIKGLVCFVLATAFSLIGMSGTIFADNGDAQGKIVRIGYYTGNTEFQDGFFDDVRKLGYAYEFYQEISILTGWSYEYAYGTKEELTDKLISGGIDIIAGIFEDDPLAGQMLLSGHDMDIDGKPQYFAVRADNTELMNELNTALDRLYSSNPDFTLTLKQKYYSHNQMYTLTDEEKQWLKEKGSLKMGYVSDNLPLSDRDESGNPTGLAKDLLTWLSDFLEMPIEPVYYDTVAQMEEGLRNSEINIAFPVYSDLWVTEKKNLFQADTIVSDRIMIVYTGEYNHNLMDTIGVSKTGIGQRYYIASYSPESEITFYDDKKATFEAVKRGEVNSMIGCSSILQHFFSKHDDLDGYHMAYLDISEEFSAAVNRNENILVSILNKAIAQMDQTAITSTMIKYSNVDAVYNFRAFLRHYSVVVIVALSIFFAILLYVFIKYRRKTKLFNEEQARTMTALESALGSASAANEAKTSFLSNMSHDIRTPLNGIIGMTAIAAANINDAAKIKDCLTKITASGKHLLALINEVLDMSKIESGEIHLNEEDIDLAELMDNLITINNPLAAEKNQDMSMRVVNVEHENVIGDPLRIQQVFTNLVSNAVKYTPKGGKINITLSEKPSNNPKRGHFEFVVEDNGIGMSKDYLPHLFEAFTRADDSSVNSVQGTGLGMTIAYNIVQMMDGDIKVESEEGKGTKFTVTLFLKLADIEGIRYEDFVNLDVLIVDDDEVICESTCITLSELGMNSEWVLSGREAIERIEKRHKEGNNYFAVLLDWKMPDMDGVETTKEIRRRIGDDMPIIIISAYDWSAIEVEATMAGANCFIGKPLFKSRLVHLFDRLLDNETEEETSDLEKLTDEMDFTGKRALLAEDNDINAEIAIEILGMSGMEIEWAHNGQEAVDMFTASKEGYYDCIFMDIQMPVMNGIEAAKTIRSSDHAAAKTIPIFAMTANAFADDVRAVLNAGMNEHVAKPLDFNVLLKLLNEYLN